MKEFWNQFMNLGIIHFMAYPQCMKGEGPVAETVEKILIDDFFQAIEITHIADNTARTKVKEMLAASHAVTAYGAQPICLANNLDLNSFNDAERKKAVDRIKEAIAEAADLGAKGVGVLSGKHPGKANVDEAIVLLVDSLKELCGEAEKSGLMLELESFDYDIDKACLIGDSTLAVQVAEGVKKEYDNFGLILDLSHFPIQYESTKDALTTAIDHITHLHLGNCVMKDKNHPAYGDQHPRFGIEGGENDIEEITEFFKVLFDLKFFEKQNMPIVSFEMKPVGNESSELLIANTKRAFTKAWALV